MPAAKKEKRKTTAPSRAMVQDPSRAVIGRPKGSRNSMPTNATAAENYRARMEAMRAAMPGEKAIKTINKVADRVAQKWHILTSEQIQSSRLEVEIAFKVLAKMLPDLKQVEIAGEVHHMHENMSRAEIDGLLISSGINPKDAFDRLN